ncbi:hypothetical protein GOZ81_10420 [Agrobacterium vitis]|uniref:hypothetical protein n=1 Tax=Agrobacterium vitis TaxID=373 RepID=UPI00137EA3C0|nr:hypothetical protein [Agrobacterium vitis]MVA71489.1 hypothetical protein [Agrobacterium vitis]
MLGASEALTAFVAVAHVAAGREALSVVIGSAQTDAFVSQPSIKSLCFFQGIVKHHIIDVFGDTKASLKISERDDCHMFTFSEKQSPFVQISNSRE